MPNAQILFDCRHQWSKDDAAKETDQKEPSEEEDGSGFRAKRLRDWTLFVTELNFYTSRLKIIS